MTSYIIARDVLHKLFGGDKRSVLSFETQQRKLADLDGAVTANVAGTEALKDGSYITLSPNAELTNEYVLSFGRGLTFDADTPGQLILATDGPNVNGGFSLQLTVAGDSTISVPLSGIMATRENTETLKNTTLETPKITVLGDYVDDAAAAVGGVPVGGVYRTASALKVRVA